MRYLVFLCTTYYPAGGLYDLRATFDTLEEATENLGKGIKENFGYNYGHIFDTESNKVYNDIGENITDEFRGLRDEE